MPEFRICLRLFYINIFFFFKLLPDVESDVLVYFMYSLHDYKNCH